MPVIQHAPVPFCRQGKGTVVSEGIAVRLNRKRIGASHSAEPAACKQIQERGHGLLGSPVDGKHGEVCILRDSQLIRCQVRQGFYTRVLQLHGLVLPGRPTFQIGVEIDGRGTALRCGYCVAVELARRHRCNTMVRQRLRRGVSRVFFAEILRLEHRRRTVPGEDHRATATTALRPKPLLFGNIVIFFDAQSQNIGRTLVLVANQSDSLVIRPGHIGWLRGLHLQYIGNRFRRTGKGHVIVLHQYITAVQNSFIGDRIRNAAGPYIARTTYIADHVISQVKPVQINGP